VPIRVLFPLPGHSPPAHNANSSGDPIGYRLSAIAYDKPSAMQGEARLRGRERIYSIA